MTPNNYLLMIWEKLPRRKVYVKTDTNDIMYVCDAEHGTALTTAKWKVQKLLMVGTWGSAILDEIWETDWYNNLATSLVVVEALSFS